MRLFLTTTFLLFVASPSIADAFQAKRPARIELELATDRGLSITATQQWLELFKPFDLGSLKIRTISPGDQPEIKSIGTSSRPVYQVIGILTRRNQLLLLEGKFTLRNKVELRRWFEKVKQGGKKALTEKRGPFGLTSEELLKLHDQLAVKVDFSTKDQSPKEIIRKIAKKLQPQLTVEPTVRKLFTANDLFRSELKGISSGTALAVVSRSLGLSLVPKKSASGKAQLFIMKQKMGEDAWTIGHLPDKKPGDLIPKMFKSVPIEIVEVPLADVIGAIETRIEAPIIFDHWALARYKIDPTQFKVSLPEKKIIYKRAINQVLYKALLKNEIRLDEASRPFLWVTTLKR